MSFFCNHLTEVLQVENQKVLKFIGAGQSTMQTGSSEPGSDKKEQSSVIYEMLIKKGYLDEQKLSYAKRVHSKLIGRQDTHPGLAGA